MNNAGVVQGKLILDLTPEDIKQYASSSYAYASSHSHFRTFGVNTLAHFWTLKAFLPEMIKNKAGHIVQIVYMFFFALYSLSTDHGCVYHGYGWGSSNVYVIRQ